MPKREALYGMQVLHLGTKSTIHSGVMRNPKFVAHCSLTDLFSSAL